MRGITAAVLFAVPVLWVGIETAAQQAAPGSRPLRDWTSELERLRRTPVLVLHGDQDQTIPVGESRRASQTMRELGMQFIYVETRGGDHNAFISRNRDTLLKVFSFFNIVRKSQRPQLN